MTSGATAELAAQLRTFFTWRLTYSMNVVPRVLDLLDDNLTYQYRSGATLREHVGRKQRIPAREDPMFDEDKITLTKAGTHWRQVSTG